MSELTPRTQSDLARYGDEEDCTYCGAPLNSRYYFCLRCATPYKDAGSVLTPIRPLRPSVGTLVKRHAPGVSTLWWTYFGVILGVGLLLRLTAGGDRLGVHVILLDAALFITTVAFAIHYWPALRPQLRRFGFDHPAAYVGLVLLAPMLALNFGYHSLLRDLTGATDNFVLQLRKDGFSQEAIIFFLCIFPAIAEEIAFRGLLQHWLQVALRPRRAIILSAALFSAMHLSILSAPYLFLAGCLLGWVKWKTGSLYPVMLIHFLHNLAAVELLSG